MNELFELLRCPACHSRLDVRWFDDGDGILDCSCGLWFPIIDQIPRMFIGEMRQIYRTDFGAFLDRYRLGDASPYATSAETKAKLATRESFGFEWTHFSEMLPEWEKNSRFYFEPLSDDGLANQLVFEGGCGKGRHTYWALKAGARVVSVDFSRAVEVARANCRELPGDRLFVQADLMALPFDAGTFDVAFSLGVLHHLPDPEGGFRRLSALVRPGGRVLVYLYHALEGEPLKRAILRAVEGVRNVTTRLPHRVLLPLTNALGYGLYAGVVLPYRVLRSFAATRALAERMPLKGYASYPVRVIVNDQFDRFSAPIENRYRRDEVRDWFDRAGLTDTSILPGAGWRAVGTAAR